MTLKVKALIFLLSISLLSGGTIAFFSKRAVQTILVEGLGKRVLLKSQDLPVETAKGLRDGNEIALLPLLQKNLEETGAVYEMALDLKGRVVAHTNVVEKGNVYHDPATLEAIRSDRPGYRPILLHDRSILDVALPIWAVRQADSSEEFLLSGGKELHEKKRLGTLRIGLALDETFQTMEQISRQVIGIIVGSAALSLLMGLVLIQGALKRVGILASGTERISRGEYGITLPIHSNDELGELARSFNGMSEELARSHQHLEEEVKRRTRELEAFVYTVSHDLKSPVVSINGLASLLKESHAALLNENGKRYVDRIIVNANFMEELIQGLLVLSRIGKKEGEEKRSEAAEVIQEIVSMQKDHLAKKNIELVVHAPLPHFTSDHTHLAQTFQNLVSNAAKFMADQPHPRIEIGGKEMAKGVEFYVRDNGIGIDPDYHEKIFAIFQRLQEVKVEGTGVGLAIVKKIVDLHGGEIRVQSRKGEGATFFIFFPHEDGRQ